MPRSHEFTYALRDKAIATTISLALLTGAIATSATCGQTDTGTSYPQAETIGPPNNYVHYNSPNGFSIQYPHYLRHEPGHDLLEGGRAHGYQSVIKIEQSRRDENYKNLNPKPNTTSPIIESKYEGREQKINISPVLINGEIVQKSEEIFPKEVFGTEVKVIAFTFTGKDGRRFIVEFSGSSDTFSQDFPSEVIRKMAESFVLP